MGNLLIEKSKCARNATFLDCFEKKKVGFRAIFRKKLYLCTQL